MKEAGINISYYQSKGVDRLPLKEFDYLIGIGCQDNCSAVPAKKHIQWQITDPTGKNMDSFRKTREEIKSKIEGLIKNIFKKDEDEEF